MGPLNFQFTFCFPPPFSLLSEPSLRMGSTLPAHITVRQPPECFKEFPIGNRTPGPRTGLQGGPAPAAAGDPCAPLSWPKFWLLPV